MNSEQFWSRVIKTTGCWEWTGSKTSGGYGNVRFQGRNVYAHRLAYTLHRGAIPDGLVIDHLCRNRSCVRPDHLEPVPIAVNTRRGAGPYGPLRTRCKNGHDISIPENVYTAPRGDHRCRVCMSASDARRTAERRSRKAKKVSA